MTRFTTTRADGRSNAEVLIGVIEAAQPGDLLTYDGLAETFGAGTDHPWTRQHVQSAVRSSLPRVRRETKRTLTPVIGQGYRVARANEHSMIAVRSERKAQRQVRAALDTLKHVNWDELTPTERTLHEAHLTVTGALCAQVSLVTRRQQKHDEAIAALLTRVETLEQRS